MSNRSNINLVGNTTQGQNVGGGAGIYKGKNGGNLLQFKSIAATGSSITIYQVGDKILISGSTGGGSVSGGANLGTGNGTIYTSLNSGNLQFKTLSGGTNVTLTCNGNYIAINAAGGASYWTKTGTDLCPTTAGDDILLPANDLIKWSDGSCITSNSNQIIACGNNINLCASGSLILNSPQIYLGGLLNASWISVNTGSKFTTIGNNLCWNFNICGGAASGANAGGAARLIGGSSSATQNGGAAEVCGGDSVSGTGGGIVLRAGAGTTTGRIALCSLPAKSTETNLVYIDASGNVSCGANDWVVSGADISPSSTLGIKLSTSRCFCWDTGAYLKSTTNGVANSFIMDNGTGVKTCMSLNGLYTIYSGGFIVSNAASTSFLCISSSGSIQSYYGDITLSGGDSASATAARCSTVKGATNSSTGLGGTTFICGGTSYDGGGGDVCICGGQGNSHNTGSGNGGNIKLIAGTGVVDGSMYLCNLPSNGGATCVVWIDSTGKLFTATPASDCRLKRNVQPITNASMFLNKICGYSAEFNELSNCEGCCEYVFMAQEVETELPLAVKNGVLINDVDYKKVEYDQLIPILWNIVKEQEIRIKSLEEKLSK